MILTYEYDSWGKLFSIKDNNQNEITDETNIGIINPFRYREYYYDTETGLYYLNSRYYNPVWGRFLNMDSYGGEIGGNVLLHNTYIYTLNNPIKYRDNGGEFAIAAAIIGAVAVVGLMAVSYKPVVSVVNAVGGAMANVLDAVAPKLNFDPTYKEKEEAKEKENTKPIVPYAPKEEEFKPCTEAHVDQFLNDVVRGYRMTIDEAQYHVGFGYDVMCDTKQDALQVALKWPATFYHDNPHKKLQGYYPHYHPWGGKNHPHIWYYLDI